MKEVSDVRIIELEPCRVASCRVESESPETDAFKKLFNWLKKTKIDINKTRFFGFDNPGPSARRKTYGYEVWAFLQDELPESDGIEIKNFEGGVYAVMKTGLDNISAAWKELIDWRDNSSYKKSTHQCLEEHLNLTGIPDNNTIIIIYLPIVNQTKLR